LQRFALGAALFAAAIARAAPPAYVGSAACAPCHAAEHAKWARSQHAQAMQEATERTVLGRFDGAAFTHAGVTTTFFRRDGKFMVRTDGPDGALADFEVKYTFGVFPLQQYLVPLPGGRLQALGVAWDARPASAGGQRWFHLYPEHTPRPGDPLHWTGIDQTWNYQCADCHSTNVRKRWEAATRRYDTTWSEIDVGCEACHGPGADHVAWAKKEGDFQRWNESKGLTVAIDERRGVSWETAAGATTAARSAPRTTHREIDACAPCHARREQFSDDRNAGTPWLDAYRPARLERGLYYADGQQRDEVYTWGSFVQSKMHSTGVTCADCHDPHDGRPRAQGNAVCTGCHMSAKFDTRAHHHHPRDSAGAACVACHMPATTYMRIDPRHDHSLRIPRPDRSVALGTPNACTQCHTKETARWAADAVARWYPKPKPGFQSYAEALHAAEREAPGAPQMLAAVARDPTQPAIARATALAALGPRLDPATLPIVTAALRDPDPIVRTAAVGALAETDPATRLAQLGPLLADPTRLVRMDAGRALAELPAARLAPGDAPRRDAALAEWVAAQRFNGDRPEGLVNLGTLSAVQGRSEEAAATLESALALDPTYAPAAVNLADLWRARGREADAEAVLRAALERTPDAAALHHALGLSLVRQHRTDEALRALGRAAELAPEEARFAFVYGVGRHDSGDRAGAIETLEAALARHPYDPSLLGALVSYQQEAGAPAKALAHARVLLEVRPNDPQLRALVDRLAAPAPR
jgi:tetratricopeptide (TPR) repeat protein